MLEVDMRASQMSKKRRPEAAKPSARQVKGAEASKSAKLPRSFVEMLPAILRILKTTETTSSACTLLQSIVKDQAVANYCVCKGVVWALVRQWLHLPKGPARQGVASTLELILRRASYRALVAAQLPRLDGFTDPGQGNRALELLHDLLGTIKSLDPQRLRFCSIAIAWGALGLLGRIVQHGSPQQRPTAMLLLTFLAKFAPQSAIIRNPDVLCALCTSQVSVRTNDDAAEVILNVSKGSFDAAPDSARVLAEGVVNMVAACKPQAEQLLVEALCSVTREAAGARGILRAGGLTCMLRASELSPALAEAVDAALRNIAAHVSHAAFWREEVGGPAQIMNAQDVKAVFSAVIKLGVSAGRNGAVVVLVRALANGGNAASWQRALRAVLPTVVDGLRSSSVAARLAMLDLAWAMSVDFDKTWFQGPRDGFQGAKDPVTEHLFETYGRVRGGQRGISGDEPWQSAFVAAGGASALPQLMQSDETLNPCVKLLGLLAKTQTCAAAVACSAALPKLLKMAEAGHCGAAVVLARLAFHGRQEAAVLKTGFVRCMAKLFLCQLHPSRTAGRGSGAAPQAAPLQTGRPWHALTLLLRSSRACAAFVEAGGMASLINMFEGEPAKTGELLASLALVSLTCPGRAALMRHQRPCLFADWLLTADPNLDRLAAFVIAGPCCPDPAVRKRLREDPIILRMVEPYLRNMLTTLRMSGVPHGIAVPALARMLASDDPEARLNAAAALQNVVIGDRFNQRALQANMGVPRLAELVLASSGPDDQTGRHAAGALRNLAKQNVVTVEELESAGVVPALVWLLREGSVAGQLAAAGALRVVAARRRFAMLRPLMRAAVPQLLVLLTAEHKALRREAQRLLRVLARDRPTAVQLLPQLPTQLRKSCTVTYAQATLRMVIKDLPDRSIWQMANKYLRR